MKVWCAEGHDCISDTSLNLLCSFKCCPTSHNKNWRFQVSQCFKCFNPLYHLTSWTVLAEETWINFPAEQKTWLHLLHTHTYALCECAFEFSVVQRAQSPTKLLLLNTKEENYRSQRRVLEKCRSLFSPLFCDHEHLEKMSRKKIAFSPQDGC